MDYPELGNWFALEGVTIGEEQRVFSDFTLWDWQRNDAMEPNVLDAIPLQSLPPDPFFPCQDLFQDIYTLLDSEMGLCDGTGEAPISKKDVPLDVCEEEKRQERCSSSSSSRERVEKAITFEEVSRYFYVPITQAAKELNVGLTQLKKKCRELGIPRWPHRKMKSLQALIKNVQDLGREDGETGEEQLRRAIDVLEREREAMERVPGMQLEERTKRLRQACFKANFKKRRLRMAEGDGRPPVAAGQTVLKQQEETEMGRYLIPPVDPCGFSCVQGEWQFRH